MKTKKTILLLGGFGFIGTNIIERFRYDDNYNLIVFEFNKVSPRLKNLNNIKTYFGDFSNNKDIEIVFKENKIDIVFHLIGTTVPATSNENIIYDINSNAIGTIELLKMMNAYNVKNIVYLSSGGTIYGIPQTQAVDENSPTNPICSYGIVKLTIEKYIHLFHHLYKMNYLILRASNPYGCFHTSMSQGFINVILKKIIKGDTIEVWGDGEVIRDYIFVEDFAEIVYNMINKNIWNEVFNIGSGMGYSINTVLKVIEKAIGEFKVNYTPVRQCDVPKIVLNVNKIKSLFKINFTPLDIGVRNTFYWHKKNS